MTGYTATFFSLTVLLGSCFHRTEPTDDRDVAISALEAHFLENQAWETGDYLMKMTFEEKGQTLKVREGTDPPNFSFEGETTTYFRLIFDFPNKRLFFIRAIDTENHVFDEDGKEIIGDGLPTIDHRLSGFVMANGECVSRSLPKNVIKSSHPKLVKNLGDTLVRFSVPELRGIGLQVFGEARRYDSVASLADQLCTPDRINKATVSSESIYLQADLGGNDPNLESRFADIRLNAKDRTIEFSEFFIKRKGVPLPDSLVRQEIEWNKEFEIPVPSHVSGYSIAGRRVGKYTYSVRRTLDAHVHWFSMNETIEEERFDKDVLRNPDEMKKQVDPEALDVEFSNKPKE